jgi:hypothetical protein
VTAAEDLDTALRLLDVAYSSLSELQRSGLSLEAGWPTSADAAYEEIGRFLYPDDGPTPRERLSAINVPGIPIGLGGRLEPAEPGVDMSRPDDHGMLWRRT